MKKSFTKARTLDFIVEKIKKYKINNLIIPDYIYFSKKKFLENDKYFIFKIQKKFKNKKIIIRSSSLSEDNVFISNAGKYLSISNVKPIYKDIKNNINKVINKFDSKYDQVLIQEYIESTNISGVIFTRDANYNSPYYTINFDTSGKTDLITSGKNNSSMNTFLVFRKKIHLCKKFYEFLKIIKIFEKIFKNDRLDIEFAKKNNKWIIFQCRPLTGNKIKKKNNDDEIEKVLVNIEKKIKKLKKRNPTLEGDTTYFSNMADWNPAEMIGVKPTVLANSLYSELITDSVWSIQRKNYRYKDVRPNILMVSLAGSPFIDLRTDFNSFLPLGLNQNLEKKIINHMLKKIKSKTYLHDKIEFEVMQTCYDIDISKIDFNFLSQKQKKDYLIKLKETTNFILNKKNNILEKEIAKLNYLEKQIKKINNFEISEIQKIFFLINDCKKFGTLPFAGIARIAFICTKIIKSLLIKKIIDADFVKNIYAEIPTITKKMNSDYRKLLKSKNFKKIFIEKYGHLRPFTYSISSKNYKEGFNHYFANNVNETKKIRTNKFKIKKQILSKINLEFKKEKLDVKANDFIDILKKSIEYREFSKFIFTKSINSIFDNLIKLSKKIKINRNDLENISIKKILNSHGVLESQKLVKSMRSEIKENKKSFHILKQIKFPDFINSSNDIYFHQIKSSRGNYITNQKISGNLIFLDKISNLNKINGKIVVIENADPGFDFIFSYRIKGLITKYGGANSHMAIRCLELNIPAIIGIGESEYNNVCKSNFIEFDCEIKKLKTIN